MHKKPQIGVDFIDGDKSGKRKKGEISPIEKIGGGVRRFHSNDKKQNLPLRTESRQMREIQE